MKFKIALFCLLSVVVFACNAPEYPTFQDMKQVKFKSIGFTNGLSATFSGNAIFHNPNAIGANVTEINLDVFIDDKKVTTIKQDIASKMAANADFTLPLNFDIPLKEVYKDIKPSLGNIFKSKKLRYQLEGVLKVGLGSLEIAVPVQYEGEEEIKL